MIENTDNFKVIAEKFPKVASELKRLWGTPGFNTYLLSLEQDTSEEHRVGFPEAVLLALFDLGAEHDKQFPDLIQGDKWIS
jgi:hypothetical protein